MFIPGQKKSQSRLFTCFSKEHSLSICQCFLPISTMRGDLWPLRCRWRDAERARRIEKWDHRQKWGQQAGSRVSRQFLTFSFFFIICIVFIRPSPPPTQWLSRQGGKSIPKISKRPWTEEHLWVRVKAVSQFCPSACSFFLFFSS